MSSNAVAMSKEEAPDVGLVEPGWLRPISSIVAKLATVVIVVPAENYVAAPSAIPSFPEAQEDDG